MTIASRYYRRVQIFLIVVFLITIMAWGFWALKHRAMIVADEPVLAPPPAVALDPEVPRATQRQRWERLEGAIRAAAPPTMRLDEVSEHDGAVAVRGAVMSEETEKGFSQVQSLFEQLQGVQDVDSLRLESFRLQQTQGVTIYPFALQARVRDPHDVAPPTAADMRVFRTVETLINIAMRHEIDVNDAVPLSITPTAVTVAISLSATAQQRDLYLAHLERAAPACRRQTEVSASPDATGFLVRCDR
ncbi:MAG: hypothetical protein HY737_05055 [Candidatus Omnitrophica bacterium]|nr:hypothetical protein [Candidatus Omnitrophota bacterium]